MSDDLNRINRNGETALILAAPRGDIEEVQKLLDAGADPCIRDRQGMTASDRARNRGFREIVALLHAAEVKAGCRKEPEKQPQDTLESETSGDVDIEDAGTNNIPFVTDGRIKGRKIRKTIGTARGCTVRAKHVGRDVMAGLKGIVGGEIKGYTELLSDGREEAIYRMQLDAEKMGANAIVCMRFSTSMVAVGAVEIMAYGTAVIVEDGPE